MQSISSFRQYILHPKRKRAVLYSLLLSVTVLCTAALVPRIYSKSSEGASRRKPPSNLNKVTGSSIAQAGLGASGPLQPRLASQAQADRMRKGLGQRFQRPGHEVSVLTGILSIAGQEHPIQIRRSQEQEGESVSMVIQGEGSVTWSSGEGAMTNGRRAAASEQRLIERVALDSPDQFILAQLRGASYYTVAYGVVPEEALQSESYSGPAWDVIRIDEPNRARLIRPESAWRMYYVNSETGLLERIVSTEEGTPVLAELLDWTNSQGEMVPGRIKWSSNGQVIMELSLTGFANGPK